MGKNASQTNLYADRVTGIVSRVDTVNDTYATILVMHPGGLTSVYSMPVKEYDSVFLDARAPLDAGDIALPATYRPPADWEARAAREAEAEVEAGLREGETEDGVRIGADV